MRAELQREFERALVEAALPEWDWEEGDVVDHSMRWEDSGGCETCGYGDPGMELWVDVRRGYAPPHGFVGDATLQMSRELLGWEIADVWRKVMGE